MSTCWRMRAFQFRWKLETNLNYPGHFRFLNKRWTFLGTRCTLPCNLSLMACFADINASQGSVATYARWGGIFNTHLIANLPRNLPVNFLKPVKIWQKYGHESVARLFGPPCIFCSNHSSKARSFWALSIVAWDSSFAWCLALVSRA